MANVYDNSFIDADILDGNIIFTRIDGSKYSLQLSELQDVTTLKTVELINDSLKFTKLSGDVTSIDLSSYNGFDSVTLNSTTKDLIFYNDNLEVAKVNFNTLINNSFVSGNPFVSVDIIGDNMVFTMVNGDTRSISIHNIQEQNVIAGVDIISDIMKFTQLNGNIKNIDLSNYKDIDDVTYDDTNMKMVFYKDDAIFKEIDIKTSFIDNVSKIIINELSSEIYQRLSLETSQRISTDSSLSSLLELETSQRISTDLILSSYISTETSIRLSSDTSLMSIVLNNNVNINTATSKIEEINDILFTEIPIYDFSGNTLSGETIIRNNVDYLIEENDNKTIQINNLFSNKSDITHTHKISPAEYKKIIKRYDIEWDNEWVKVENPSTFNFNYSHKVVNLNVFINNGFGLINLTPIINYSSTKTNNTSYTNSSFYISDIDGVINKNNDFDYIYLEYDIINDNNYKYDSKKYVLGENVINDHYSSDAAHSRSTSFSFNSAYMQTDNTIFNGNVIESIYDPLVMGSLSMGFTPTFCAIREANLVFHPYVNGASTENYGSNPNILSVASHYGNTFLRYDITPNAYTFLDNAIAVVARPNNITQINRSDSKTANFTSFGYGAEFLEEASNYKMNENYTHWTYPTAFGWGYIDQTGLIITNLNNSTIKNSHFNIMELEVGSRIGVGLSYPHESYQIRTVVEILSDFTLMVDVPFEPLQPGTNYIFVHDAHIGSHWGIRKFYDYPTNQDSYNRFFWQSPTTGLVAGKLKKIKMMTNVSWGMVRDAARKTAYLYDNTTVISVDLSANSTTDKIYVSNTDVFPDADAGYPNRVIGTVMVNGNIFYFKGKNKTSSYIYGDNQLIKNATSINTEIKLIWDIYRGFGEIQVDDAINYINNNYKTETYRKILADKLEGERNINLLLEYNDLYPNSPISKKMISDIGNDIKFTNIDELANIDNLGKIRYLKNGNSSVAQMCMQTGENQYEWVNISNVNTW